MGNVTEGLCKFPTWEGVGGKTAMYQSKSAGHAFIGQVGKITANLVAGKLPFVHHRFVRQRSNIKTYCILFNCLLNKMGSIISENKKFPFEA